MKEDNFTIIQNQYRLQTFKFKKTSKSRYKNKKNRQWKEK